MVALTLGFCGWGLDLWRSVWLGVCWLFSLVGWVFGFGLRGVVGWECGFVWVGWVVLVCVWIFRFAGTSSCVRYILDVGLSCVGCSVDLLLW